VLLAGASPAGARLHLAVNTVSFASARDGMVGGALCRGNVGPCASVLARTTDGGERFRITRRFGSARQASAVGVGAAVYAALPGVSYVSTGPHVYRTRDGGRHLVRVPLRGSLLGFAASGPAAFAVTHPCKVKAHCAARLWHSFDAGRTWWYTTLRGAPGRGQWFDIEAANAANVVVDYQRSGPEDTSVSGLLVSADGGRSWSRRRHPCRRTYRGTHVTTADGLELWMGCNETDGSGRQYRSVDGGSHWRPLVHPNRSDCCPRNTLGGDGYTWDLRALGAGVAVASPRKAVMQVTFDGGLTWRAGPPWTWDEGVSGATIARWNSRIAWFVGPQFGLFRTLDGGHTWRALRSTGF
jgi:photosystem II stability/assembly factor-like uncharacterized protein